jgi:DnaJ-class molecular chaperone
MMEYMPCLQCGGFGYLGDGEDEDDTEECPMCQGNGTVPVREAE